MAALTVDQMVTLRRQIGTSPSDAEVQAIYDRHEPDLDATVLEILEIRAADMRRKALSFQVPGEYGESRSIKQLEALEEQIASLGGGETGLGVVTVIEPDYRYLR